jgi:UDP-N-acetylglucosamine 1-carboxyvinyltransferase
MAAAGISGGELELENCPVWALDTVIDKFQEMGLSVDTGTNGSTLVGSRAGVSCTDITTQPFPGFPTDMQAQFMALMCVAEGSGMIQETIFENRFLHALELMRMGAQIKIRGDTALIRGERRLTGAPVQASDLRASAALVLAGLAAGGTTTVRRIYHLDRGYEHIEHKLSQAGARIHRERE